MSLRRPLLRLLAPLLLLATAHAAAARTPLEASALAEELAAVLDESYSDDEPGAAVLVARGDELLLRQGRGLADVELSVDILPSMPFRLGSITKQFTAAAIHLLAERGKLSIDDEITKFLPEFPTQGHRITLRHLLTHTSGISNYTSIPGYMSQPVKRDVTLDQLIRVFRDLPMDFAPGEKWQYSNSGYVLLGAVIEKASGQSYSEFLKASLFEPLGLTSTLVGEHASIVPNRVKGYLMNGEQLRNAPFVSMSQAHAAGALLSTVDDMWRWSRALFRGEILSAESLEAMTTPAVLNDGEVAGYAHGLGIGTFRGHDVIRHGGGIHGFTTVAQWFPDEEVLVVVLCNVPGRIPGPGLVAQRLAALALGIAGFVAAAERLAALYRSELEGHPGWEASLKATVWWGCGSAHLSDIAALLERIDTPRARALLQSEPYEGVSREAAGAAPSSAPPTAATDCNAPETAAARSECAGRELAAANAAHERVFEECKERVAPGLRPQLLGAESSWKRNRQTECAVEVAAYPDKDEDARAFVRARCLARTTRRRTQALLNTHPECADPR